MISCNNVFTACSAKIYDGKEVLAKVRYSAKPAKATIKEDGNRIIATFEEPQRVMLDNPSYFMKGDHAIGGGFISE